MHQNVQRHDDSKEILNIVMKRRPLNVGTTWQKPEMNSKMTCSGSISIFSVESRIKALQMPISNFGENFVCIHRILTEWNSDLENKFSNSKCCFKTKIRHLKDVFGNVSQEIDQYKHHPFENDKFVARSY